MPQPFYGGGIKIKLFKAVKLQHHRNAHFGYINVDDQWLVLSISGAFRKHCTDTLAWQMIIYRKKIALVTQHELEEAVWYHRGACRVFDACYKMNRQHGHQKTREGWSSIKLKHYYLVISAFIQGKILLDLIKIQ